MKPSAHTRSLLALAPHFHLADGHAKPAAGQVSLPGQAILVQLAKLAQGDEVALVAALRARADFRAWVASGKKLTPTGLRRWMKQAWVEGSETATGKHFEVELSWLGEGIQGDFDLADPEDVPLLRMDISRRDGEEMQDASFCTQIPVTVGEKRARELAKEILAVVEERLASGATDGGRTAQRLSWIDERGVAHCSMPDGSVPC